MMLIIDGCQRYQFFSCVGVEPTLPWLYQTYEINEFWLSTLPCRGRGPINDNSIQHLNPTSYHLHTCDLFLFRRDLPIIEQISIPIWNFKISLYILYICLFQISDLPISNQEFPSLFNHSPYFEK